MNSGGSDDKGAVLGIIPGGSVVLRVHLSFGTESRTHATGCRKQSAWILRSGQNDSDGLNYELKANG